VVANGVNFYFSIPIMVRLAVWLLLFWRVSGVPLGGSGKNGELSGAAKTVDEIRVVPGFKGPLPSRHFSGCVIKVLDEDKTYN
jgi:hypothetical protein